MSRLAPLALGLSLGMSALVALSLPALARGGGGHGGGGGGGGGGRGGGMSMSMGGGGGGFGVGRFGGGGGGFVGGSGRPMVGMAAMSVRPGYAGRPFIGGARFAPGYSVRRGFIGRPYNRVRWGNRGWWRPGLGVGLCLGFASAPYWGWDDYYASPLIGVGFDPGVGIGGIGGFCATPVRTCQLIDVAPIGTGCSCQVAGGRARGVVSP